MVSGRGGCQEGRGVAPEREGLLPGRGSPGKGGFGGAVLDGEEFPSTSFSASFVDSQGF